jgi:heme/copper-type cytochrome/quinol oxidase subunit 1
MLRTKDPEDVAILYLATAFGLFVTSGAVALLMPVELVEPGLQLAQIP